jgi:hypothetical protein
MAENDSWKRFVEMIRGNDSWKRFLIMITVGTPGLGVRQPEGCHKLAKIQENQASLQNILS